MITKPLLNRIEKKYKTIQAKRPLSKTIVKKLKEQLALELTYNSNAIEGNKLTLKETYLVINDGITVKGKSLKDHLEAKNHDQAIHFLYDLVEYKKRQTISEQLIRTLQQVIIKDIEVDEAGKYRTGMVMITGSKHKPPQASEIPHLMHKFLSWVKTNWNKLHPVVLAAQAHHKLVHIHPFTDGNGRTARLLMNMILIQHGYPMVIILKNERKKYYSALEKADKGHTNEIEKLIAQAVERSLNIYIQAIHSSRDSRESLIPLSALAKQSRYSEKYLNLLARSGRLDAHKENRNWLSSIKALDEYLASRERRRN